jgi:hypothetical protein
MTPRAFVDFGVMPFDHVHHWRFMDDKKDF